MKNALLFSLSSSVRWWALIPVILFSGCASIPNSPKETVPKSFTMPGSFEQVWDATLMTVINEYIPIETQDEDAGYIKGAEFQIQGNEYSKWTEKMLPASHGFGQIELQLIRVSDEKTKIEIRAQFQAGKHSVIQSKGRYHSSTGAFESRLAGRIHAYLILKQYPKLIQLITGCNFRWNEDIEHYEVSGVELGSFGEEQGFRNGDIIIQMNGVDMTMENFFKELTAISETQTKSFFLDRGGVGMTVEVMVYHLPDDLPWFGFQAQRDQLTGQFQVTDVVGDSPAQKAGLQVGDVLLQEEKTLLTNWHNYYAAMSGAHIGVDRDFLISREGTEHRITIHTEHATERPKALQQLAVAAYPAA